VNEGQELIKDQKEALAKYEVVQQNLEFARDLQKQFQSMSLDLDKQQRKQLKREKMVKRQQETCRIVELLKLQTVLSSLKCTAVTKQLKDTPVVNDEGLKKLGDWSEFVTPAPLGHACFTEKLNSAAEHLVDYLEELESNESEGSHEEIRRIVDQISKSGVLLSKELETSKLEMSAVSLVKDDKEKRNGDVVVDDDDDDDDDDDLTSAMIEKSWAEQTELDNRLSEQQHAVVHDEDIAKLNGNGESILTTSSSSISSSSDSPLTTLSSLSSTPPTSTRDHLPLLSDRVPPMSDIGYTFMDPLHGVSHSNASSHVNEFDLNPQNGHARQKDQKDVLDIVSAIKGNYDFLQDSEIETEAPENEPRMDAVDYAPCSSIRSSPHNIQSSAPLVAESHPLIMHHPYPAQPYIHLPFQPAIVGPSPAYIQHCGTNGINYSHPVALTTDYLLGSCNPALMSHGFIATTASNMYYAPNAGHMVSRMPMQSECTMNVPQVESVSQSENNVEEEWRGDSERAGQGLMCEDHLSTDDKKPFTMNPHAHEFKSKYSTPENSEHGGEAGLMSDVLTVEHSDALNAYEETVHDDQRMAGCSNGYTGRRMGNGFNGFRRPRGGFYYNRNRGGFNRYRNDDMNHDRHDMTRERQEVQQDRHEVQQERHEVQHDRHGNEFSNGWTTSRYTRGRSDRGKGRDGFDRFNRSFKTEESSQTEEQPS